MSCPGHGGHDDGTGREFHANSFQKGNATEDLPDGRRMNPDRMLKGELRKEPHAAGPFSPGASLKKTSEEEVERDRDHEKSDQKRVEMMDHRTGSNRFSTASLGFGRFAVSMRFIEIVIGPLRKLIETFLQKVSLLFEVNPIPVGIHRHRLPEHEDPP